MHQYKTNNYIFLNNPVYYKNDCIGIMSYILEMDKHISFIKVTAVEVNTEPTDTSLKVKTTPKVTTVEVNAVQNVNFRYDQETRSKIIATQIAKFRYEQDTQARVIATQIANFISNLDTNTKVEFDKKIANTFISKIKALKTVALRSRSRSRSRP